MLVELKQYLQTNNVVLVAVSKTKPVSSILELYQSGQRVFGENRVQEMVDKQAQLPEDISWHMIGGLQKNKVKYIAPFISLIHSVDSVALAKIINKEAIKNARTIDILLQIKIAQEETKSGFIAEDAFAEVQHIQSLSNVRVRGMMGMGTFTADNEVTLLEFQAMKASFDKMRKQHFSNSPKFDTLSMGMSSDYKIAVDCGSTMVRIGSLLFGSRS